MERVRRLTLCAGAVRLDGEMVDEATKKLAAGVLARAGGHDEPR
jgi:citrate lyase beta subunit